MSAENVELVRSMHPGPEVDLASVLVDEDELGRWRTALSGHFHSDVQATMRLPGMMPVGYAGLDGLRAAWRDWLGHWASYRDEIEDVIDDGERVVVIHRYQARPRPGAAVITRRRATVWTMRDGRVANVDFNVPYDEALAGMRSRGIV